MPDNPDFEEGYLSAPASLPPTLVELLRRRARHEPRRAAYTFLTDGEEVHLTYGELDRRARAIAALLQEMGAGGERVLLLYPPGLDYIAAFFGCLYAGAVAVPAYPPRLNRSLRAPALHRRRRAGRAGADRGAGARPRYAPCWRKTRT